MESIALRDHIERALRRLQGGEGLSVSDRVDLAGLAAECLQATSDVRSRGAALALLQMLAADPHAVVRRAAAGASFYLPPGDFEHLVASLAKDPDPSVVNVVAQVLVHRSRAERACPSGVSRADGSHGGHVQCSNGCGSTPALCASVTIGQFIDCVGGEHGDGIGASLQVLLAALERPAEQPSPAPHIAILTHLLVGVSAAPPGCPLMRALAAAMRVACEAIERAARQEHHGRPGAACACGTAALGVSAPENCRERLGMEGLATAPALPHHATSEAQGSSALRPFEGGELVFHDNRVELLGATLVRVRCNAYGYRLLQALAKKEDDGRFVSYSGNELAAELRIENGQNGVASCVKNLRTKAKRIFKVRGFRHRRGDVIESGGPGYRLNAWIRVKDASGGLFPVGGPRSRARV